MLIARRATTANGLLRLFPSWVHLFLPGYLQVQLIMLYSLITTSQGLSPGHYKAIFKIMVYDPGTDTRTQGTPWTQNTNAGPEEDTK